MSDDGYEDMEADREERGLSRSAYVEQAVRRSINRNTKFESLSESASESALSAFALYAVVQIVTFPAAAEWLLLGAAAVFAAAGVVGYVSEVVDLEALAQRVDLTGRSVEEVDEVEDGKAAAAMHPTVRDAGGVLILLALVVIAVTAVI